MRYALVAVWVSAVVSSQAIGQAAPYLATVTSATANLRVGPSEQYPVTATLKPGDPIWVDHEDENGWLAVQDPPGKSYTISWVSVQFVSNFDTTKPTPQNVTVEEATVLRPGQLGDFKPLADFGKVRVPRGTILTVIGQRVTMSEKSWYPVLPPAGDFRYIPKQTVKPERTLNTSFTIRDRTAPFAAISAGNTIPPQAAVMAPVIGPPAMPAGTTIAGAGAAAGLVPSPPSQPATQPVPPKPVVNNPVWTQAEAAEQDGRLDDAEKLYFQLARQMNEPGGDHDIANLCYTRIHSLRERKRTLPPAVGSTRTALVPTSQTGNVALPPAPPSDPPSAGKPVSGTLVRAKIDYEGRVGKTYLLELSPGISIVYVVAAPGVDLERYLNKWVDVYGLTSTHRDLSKPLVMATRAEIAPPK